MVNDGIRTGAVRPLSRKVFDRDDVEQAFRYMAAGKHIGKVKLIYNLMLNNKFKLLPFTGFTKNARRRT